MSEVSNPYEAPREAEQGRFGTRGPLSRLLRTEVRWYLAMIVIPAGVFGMLCAWALAVYAYLNYMGAPVILR
jgi:hypothetical protein